MATSHHTHSSRAARALAKTSALSYNQALDAIRRAARTPRPEEFTDPEFTAAFIAEHHRARAGTVQAAGDGRVTGATDDVVWARNGEFPLFGGGAGNPGCDVCGTHDAVVKVNGVYLCRTAAMDSGLVVASGDDRVATAAEVKGGTFTVTIRDDIGHSSDVYEWVDLFSDMRDAIRSERRAMVVAGELGVGMGGGDPHRRCVARQRDEHRAARR